MNYRLVAAAVILVAYAGLAGFMMFCAQGWEEPGWSHGLTVFSAFGAIATAAASVLLGVEVQQANVAQANQRADQATANFAAARQAVRSAIAAADGPAINAAAQLTSDDRLALMHSMLKSAASTWPDQN